jgi:hypothetical protein
MPRRAGRIIRRIGAGLMFLAVLMLSATQLPPTGSGHGHAAGHHAVMTASIESSSAPCSGHCDHHAHAAACCVASCAAVGVALPFGLPRPSQALLNAIVYPAAVLADPVGAAPNPGLRPPERVG